MSMGLSQFVASLASSGLMSAGDAERCGRLLVEGRPPRTAMELARELVRRGRLTRFQARALLAGATRGLSLGSYVLLDRIGAGGMGQVFRAQHRRMKRIVALKVLPAKLMESPEAIHRFQREVEAAARLTHPNIVTAYDADEHAGVLFLVMEHVDGRDLVGRVQQFGPLPLSMAVDCIRQTAQGLDYAHRQRVVHRDIKPGNLLIDGQGTVKILDMGLARMAASEQEEGALEDSLTHFGQIMGTVDFMSPEQAEDTRQADARSDIYSLGCTLYSVLTGQYPFPADTFMRKLLAHREGKIPSLRSVRREAPEELDRLFAAMVAKRPGDRPQSMAEVIAALDACQAAHEALRQPWLAQEQARLAQWQAERSAVEDDWEHEEEAPAADNFDAPSSAATEIQPPTRMGGPGKLASDSAFEFQLESSAPPDVAARQSQEATVRREAAQTPTEAAPRPIEVSCVCGQRFSARPELAGKTVRCLKCGGPLAIPRPSKDKQLVVACACGRRYAARPELAGKRLPCPACGDVMLVPPRPTPPAFVMREVACRCGQHFTAKGSLAGKTVKCPRCGAPLAIPAS